MTLNKFFTKVLLLTDYLMEIENYVKGIDMNFYSTTRSLANLRRSCLVPTDRRMDKSKPD